MGAQLASTVIAREEAQRPKQSVSDKGSVSDRTAQPATDCFAALAMTTLVWVMGERFCGAAAKPFPPLSKKPRHCEEPKHSGGDEAICVGLSRFE